MKCSWMMVAFFHPLIGACDKQVVSVSISPANVNLDKAGATQLLVASGIREDGEMSAVRSTWASSDPKVATVDTAGRVTAVSTGTATIAAKQDQMTGIAWVSVEITGMHEAPLRLDNPRR